uniref:Uncharacterized protein n=1 Tax=Anguilla anguilla TaxID=7936 RepID=A0A0E9PB64_ANGAN
MQRVLRVYSPRFSFSHLSWTSLSSGFSTSFFFIFLVWSRSAQLRISVELALPRSESTIKSIVFLKSSSSLSA